MIALCGICGGPMAGSNLVDVTDGTMLASVYVLHLVDEHWELIERIKATTGDGEARLRLKDQLVKEFGQ